MKKMILAGLLLAISSQAGVIRFSAKVAAKTVVFSAKAVKKTAVFVAKAAY